MSNDPDLIRILTVDDHPVLRKGIAALVNAESDMKLVAEASSGEEAIEKFRRHRPDVTLMDIQLSGLNGIEAISQIHSSCPCRTTADTSGDCRGTCGSSQGGRPDPPRS